MAAGGEVTVSSRELARRAGTTAAQVRKDLSSFGSFGKRGMGYAVAPLAARVRAILGLDRRWPVVLVGAGRIGRALFEYPHFRERGFEIVAVVDRAPEKIGRRWGDLVIQPPERLARVIREGGVELAVTAVPAEEAQGVANVLTRAGVRGILNFAPVQLQVDEGVVVNDVNLALEMEALSFALGVGGGTGGPGGS
jgi:redox-sensing transcriptional repressor